MMAGALIHTTYFTLVDHERKLQTNGTGKPKRTVKMMSNSYAHPMRIRTFSGLRGSNALDYNIMITNNQDFHSKDFLTTSFQRKKISSRIVPKATFERFTEKAIKVIMLAQEESRSLGHNFVGTEQIFLGLIGEGTGIAAKVLKSMGISLIDARVEVEKLVGRGRGFVAVEIPFTPRTKRVVELSLEEVRKLGHDYIGTEHLLLGLLREGEGVAARVLEELGADPSTIRTQVIRMIEEGTEAVGAGEKMPTPDEYVTNLPKHFSTGMKFQISFEGEEAPRQRLTGTITGMVSCDPKIRASSPDSLLLTTEGGSSSKVTAKDPSPNVQESTRCCTKIHKEGTALGRSLDLTKFKNYDELINELDKLFEFNGELKNRNKNWMIIYKDTEGDMMLVGDDPWKEFCGMVSKIFIYTKDKIQSMNNF